MAIFFLYPSFRALFSFLPHGTKSFLAFVQIHLVAAAIVVAWEGVEVVDRPFSSPSLPPVHLPYNSDDQRVQMDSNAYANQDPFYLDGGHISS